MFKYSSGVTCAYTISVADRRSVVVPIIFILVSTFWVSGAKVAGLDLLICASVLLRQNLTVFVTATQGCCHYMLAQPTQLCAQIFGCSDFLFCRRRSSRATCFSGALAEGLSSGGFRRMRVHGLGVVKARSTVRSSRPGDDDERLPLPQFRECYAAASSFAFCASRLSPRC